jgi:hypothetical protein
MTEKLDSLDDVKHSVIGHHAADKIRWENQKAWNQFSSSRSITWTSD